MNALRKGMAALLAASLVGTGGIVFAEGFLSPAQIVSELTSQPVAELYEQRADGKTYGSIAEEAGVLEEFQEKMLEQKKLILEQRVQEGRMTQAQADALLKAIEENQATCDGSGGQRLGNGTGACFGCGAGQGMGQGMSRGTGQGRGAGNGLGQGWNGDN